MGCRRRVMMMKGFNLVECCVSMALILIILSALFQQYMQVKQHDDMLHASIEEAMEIRTVLDFMRDRIQHAGFTPCQALHYLQHPSEQLSKTDLASITISPNQIVCRRMGEPFTSADAISTRRIRLMKTIPCLPGDEIVIADCEHVEIHLVKQIEQRGRGMEIELQPPLIFNYHSAFYVGPWVEESFFTRPNKQGENSFIYQAKHTETLTTHIQNMIVKRDTDKVHVLLMSKQHEHLNMQVRLRMP